MKTCGHLARSNYIGESVPLVEPKKKKEKKIKYIDGEGGEGGAIIKMPTNCVNVNMAQFVMEMMVARREACMCVCVISGRRSS